MVLLRIADSNRYATVNIFPVPAHGYFYGRCSVFLIRPISDNGQILAVTLPLISARGSGP